MRIDLLRHGEPVGGRKYRGCGIDDPLSARGWAQMREVAGGFHGWTRVVSSPMCRCREFAEQLSHDRDLPLRVEPKLVEMAFGEWEGLHPDQVQARDPASYQAFYRDARQGLPEGAEAPASLVARVGEVVDGLCRLPDSEHVLIVAHGGVIRAALTWALGLPLANMFRLQLDYAQISRLSFDTQGLVRLVFHARQSPGGA